MTVKKNEQVTNLQKVFTFNPSNQSVRIELIHNQLWFVAKDVCDALTISNSRDAISRLDEDERSMSVIPTPSGKQETNLVNESGLYSLIFQSRKPEAKAFRKWVTGEVLPTIRQTGGYAIASNDTATKRIIAPSIDMRHEPYTHETINNFPTRRITYNDTHYYSINDIMSSIGSTTGSHQIVKKLNIRRTIAVKIHLFGNTLPCWMCTSTGVLLLMSGSRKHNNQLTNKED